MIVKRITTNITAEDLVEVRRFYVDVLGLDVAMDLGWVITLTAPTQMAPQLSLASEGGSGTAVPDISIEVDDLDGAEQRVRAAGFKIEYGPVDEPWGVRRFYVRDPVGKLINLLMHT